MLLLLLSCGQAENVNRVAATAENKVAPAQEETSLTNPKPGNAAKVVSEKKGLEHLVEKLIEFAKKSQEIYNDREVEEAVKKAIDEGVNVNATFDLKEGEYEVKGITLLHYAVQQHNSSLAAYLIDQAGANINARDFQGVTPLMLSLYCGADDIFHHLIRKAAKKSIQDHKGNSVMHIAMVSSNLYDKLKGIPENQMHLHQVKLTRISRILDELFVNEGDFVIENDAKQTPILLTEAQGDTAYVSRLLEDYYEQITGGPYPKEILAQSDNKGINVNQLTIAIVLEDGHNAARAAMKQRREEYRKQIQEEFAYMEVYKKIL